MQQGHNILSFDVVVHLLQIRRAYKLSPPNIIIKDYSGDKLTFIQMTSLPNRMYKIYHKSKLIPEISFNPKQSKQLDSSRLAFVYIR